MRSLLPGRRALLTLLGSFLLLPSAIGAEPVPARADLDQLIRQLGDEDFQRRAEASRRLARIGLPALEALRQAARQHPDPEVRRRAARLVRAMEKEQSGEILSFGAGGGYWLNRVAFTPDGKQAVATGGAVILYDLQTGRELHRSMELAFARRGLALSPDGRYFLTGHQNDHVLRLGDVQSGKEVRTFEGHKAGIHAVAFSPDCKRAVSGGDDATLRLWDVKTARELRQFPGITDRVRSVAYSRDGRRIVSGHYGPGSTHLVRLWDVDGGKEVRSFRGHSNEVSAVSFTLDGKSIVSAGMDSQLIVWDLSTGKRLRTMTHAGGISGAAVSPDGARALTAGFRDRTVRLWDLATGRELRHLDGHLASVLGVAFSPDGRRALSSDSDCTVRLWRLP